MIPDITENSDGTHTARFGDVTLPVTMTRERSYTGLGIQSDAHRDLYWHAVTALEQLPDINRVIDSPCGSGYGSEILSRQWGVTGIDMSAEAVAFAKHRAPRARIMPMDMTDGEAMRIVLGERTNDAIVSIEGLEHVADPTALLTTFRDLLRPGGVLFYSTPDKHQSGAAKGNPNPHHPHEMDREELLLALQAAGFTRVLELSTHDSPTIMGVAVR